MGLPHETGGGSRGMGLELPLSGTGPHTTATPAYPPPRRTSTTPPPAAAPGGASPHPHTPHPAGGPRSINQRARGRRSR